MGKLTIPILTLFVFFSWLSSPYAQNEKQIRIEHADRLTYIKEQDNEVRKLIGNVELRQKELTMFCDSALFYTDNNSVDAFGNVHILQGDSLDIYSDSLKYNGTTEQAIFYRNVKLDHNELNLTTDLLEYNVDSEQAHYYNNGKVVNDETELTSKRGHYYAADKMSYFKDSVRLNAPDYQLEADTLGFDAKNEIAYFYGPTHITLDDGTVDCVAGRYNTDKKEGWFGKNTVLDQPPQTLHCDSMYLDQDSGYARMYKPFRWVDTSKSTILSGKRGRFYRENNYMLAYDSLLLTNIMDGDSLHMNADTFRSYNDTATGARQFFAYHDVSFYKSDIQGTCDSLYYNYKDSTFHMYRNPILWNKKNQMTGDTIRVSLANEQLDSLRLLENAMVVSKEKYEVFNQVRGRNIYGAFQGDQLGNMYVSNNSKSIYFGQDDDDAYIGVNEATCSNMLILFKEDKVNKIKFLEKPEATFTPIQETSPESHRIENFQWLDKRRPRSKKDILNSENK